MQKLNRQCGGQMFWPPHASLEGWEHFVERLDQNL
jgi:hypothetical protein